jgi:type II secretory pathway pseudopilin PulG
MPARWIDRSEGFSLVEAVVATSILTVGLLALAQVFVTGMQTMAGATSAAIAREKAREAVESVHTARDTRVIPWAQIRNVAQGGVFADGEMSLRQAGPDGLMNTTDDTAAIEEIRAPGPDGVLGTTDDIRTPLSNFWRTITITDLPGEPSLRQLQVTIRYRVGPDTRTFTLTTYVSSYA